MTDLYQEIIIEEYKHPRNVGMLDDADLVLGGGNASCGDEVEIHLKLEARSEETEKHISRNAKRTTDYGLRIMDLKWSGRGCAISQAAMSVLSDKILKEELTLKDVKNITKHDLLEMLGLDEINPGREKCLMVGLSAFLKVNEEK